MTIDYKAQALVQAFNSDMTFSKVFNLSGPQFTTLENMVVVEINELIPVKWLERCLAWPIANILSCYDFISVP